MISLRHLGACIGMTVATLSTAQDVAPPIELAPERMSVRVPGTTVEFELVACPPGEGVTADGSEVEIGPLWVLPTEVTWDLYDIFVFALDEAEAGPLDAVSRPSKPYVPPDRGYGHAGYPAIGMTRHGAEAFCTWLSARTGIGARLPTPVEWMHLASAGSEPESEELGAIAWFDENTDNTTEPVGRKLPNAFGLYDTLGNAAEYVVTDTRKPIAMGGSFHDPVDSCTVASSQKQHSSWNTSDPQIPKSRWWLADCGWVGFRFVVEREEEGADDDD